MKTINNTPHELLTLGFTAYRFKLKKPWVDKISHLFNENDLYLETQHSLFLRNSQAELMMCLKYYDVIETSYVVSERG